MIEEKEVLHRSLEERHINLMALGAAIGVGLFLGASTAIKMAGPAVVLSYLFGGIAIFFIMRALGEMALHSPVTGSFSHYATNYIGPLSGYLTGWTYWMMWIVTCMAEITAIGVYMGYWYPDVPQWIWALTTIIILSSVNFLTVKIYGELEFWFALIKILTILLMIVASIGMITVGFGNNGIPTGISNLWTHGGFMPNGVKGIFMSLQIVMYAYLGIEMIGLTAGETRNPQKSLARAIDSVFWRILLFYIGSLGAILAIYPWDQIGTQGSPFVMTFERIGIPAAAGLINFVVLTAALSSSNSGVFSTGRMLYSLAKQQQAPSLFAKVSKNGIPASATLVSIILLLFCVLLNYLAPKEIFIWLTAVAAFSAIWTWTIILLSQLAFRRSLSPSQIAQLPRPMPFWPLGSYFALAFLVLVIGLMAYFPDTRVALIIGPIWLLILTTIYYLMGYNNPQR